MKKTVVKRDLDGGGQGEQKNVGSRCFKSEKKKKDCAATANSTQEYGERGGDSQR